jgi:calcium-dependent protein kinase
LHQVLTAVDYLHERGICHRDIKAENFLISKKGDLSSIKLFSFKNATQNGVEDKLYSGMSKRIGTLYYIAPEVIIGDYGLQCDMWSVGVLSYIMLSGKLPMKGKNDHQTINLIKSGFKGQTHFNTAPWDRISDHAKDFVEQLLNINVQERLTAKEALDHPWIIEARQHNSKISKQLLVPNSAVIYGTVCDLIDAEQQL